MLIELKRRPFVRLGVIFLTAWGILRMQTTKALYINVIPKYCENETQHLWRPKVKYNQMCHMQKIQMIGFGSKLDIAILLTNCLLFLLKSV